MFKTHHSALPGRAAPAILLVIVALILAACAPSAAANLPPTATVPPAATSTSVPPPPTDTVAPTATSAPAAGGVIVNVTTKNGLGTFLVDGKGMTLYVFTKDNGNVSACTSAGCLKAWPILEAASDPVAGQGVTGKLGVVTRADGKKQVTYNDMPLYYFAADHAAGDTNGQGVGGSWYVLDPSGTMIKSGGAPTPTGVANTATSAPAAGGVMVNVATKDGLGTFLVDGKGMTLYVFTKDNGNVSACTSAGCLKAWPILEAASDPVAGQGVTGKLGVVTRADDKKQVTYNDMPLYYFAADHAAGDTNGQGVGGSWYVLDPSGAMIKSGGAPTPSATNTPGY